MACSSFSVNLVSGSGVPFSVHSDLELAGIVGVHLDLEFSVLIGVPIGVPSDLDAGVLIGVPCMWPVTVNKVTIC